MVAILSRGRWVNLVGRQLVLLHVFSCVWAAVAITHVCVLVMSDVILELLTELYLYICMCTCDVWCHFSHVLYKMFVHWQKTLMAKIDQYLWFFFCLVGELMWYWRDLIWCDVICCDVIYVLLYLWYGHVKFKTEHAGHYKVIFWQ